MGRTLALKRGGGTGSRPLRPRKRRTTVTLPEPLLAQAGRLALQRRQSLSAMVAGFIEDGLRNAGQGARRVRAMREIWKRAIVPASEEERLLLEGIVLSEPESDAT